MKNPKLTCAKHFLFFISLSFITAAAFSQQHTISSFTPANAGAGETVTITGTNFSSITSVTFGGVVANSFTVVSATKITAVTGSGSSGSITVVKTGFTNATKTGFTFSTIPTITDISTDFGGFWNTNTTLNSGTFPNDAHHLLSFTYGGATYSTGVNDAALSANGITYSAANYKGLPVVMNGITSGVSLFIVAASNIDGNTAAGLYTHPNIKDLTIESVLTDGINGLNLGTGYTNLPVGATSNFSITAIMPAYITDTKPALIITQIADPSASAFDTYKFVDAGGATVGNQIQIDLSKIAPLGTYYLDLFTVPTGVTYGLAKPNGISAANTTRQLRFMGLRLSDFGITAANYSQVKSLQIVPSGVTDMAFVAYNTAAISVPPSITQNLAASNTKVCSIGGGSAYLAVNGTSASGGALTYTWEASSDTGVTWSPVSNGGIYSGATSNALTISAATAGYLYRATVTETGSGFTATSADFAITGVTSSALGGTLNPTGFTNCLNAASGTTTLSVNPTGGTGSYNYQWATSTTVAGIYTNIAGANYNSFSPPLTGNGTLHYKVLITSGCSSNLSTAAAVTINGEAISTVTNGSVCNTGTVALSATATGGTINWYAASTGGASLGSAAGFTTPSISATTTYYASTTSGSCISARTPVVATVVSTIALSSANFNITNSTDVCAGSGSDVTVTGSALIDGTYTINYTISGSNTVNNTTVTLVMTGGSGTFTTVPLSTAGANTITVSAVVIGGCTITPSSGNTSNFNVNSGSPLASNFSLSASNGCTNASSIVIVTSNTLASGTYLLSYQVSGTNAISTTTAQVVFTAGTPGSGSFNLPVLSNAGNANTISASAIALLTSPNCSTTLSTNSGAFVSNMPTAADAGLPQAMCANDAFINITGSADAVNYSALNWSTPNGTGSFVNNATLQALTSTEYHPDANDIARGFVYLTLNAAANTGCANITKTVTLTINPISVGGNVAADQTIVAGTQPADLVLSGFTGAVIKWQQSADATFTSPADIANTAATLTGAAIGNLNTTTYFRAVVKSSTCGNANSNFAIINVSTLPVTLLYFTGHCLNNAPLLEWATSAEYNNKYFTVEKSSDARNWSSLKAIPGAGNSNLVNLYSYKDSSSSALAAIFYRLRQTDVDGRSTFSKVISVNCSNQQKEMMVVPNPGKDIFVISNLPLNSSLRIYNAQGMQVIRPLKIKSATTAVNLKSLPAGMYYVLVNSGGDIFSKKIVKE